MFRCRKVLHAILLQKQKKLIDISIQYGSKFAVIKAQIHAGGRGKGTIKGTDQRGVAVAKNAEDVKQIAQNILGGTLVTIQTGEAGKLVNKVLVAQDVYYEGPESCKRILFVCFIR